MFAELAPGVDRRPGVAAGPIGVQLRRDAGDSAAGAVGGDPRERLRGRTRRQPARWRCCWPSRCGGFALVRRTAGDAGGRGGARPRRAWPGWRRGWRSRSSIRRRPWRRSCRRRSTTSGLGVFLLGLATFASAIARTRSQAVALVIGFYVIELALMIVARISPSPDGWSSSRSSRPTSRRCWRSASSATRRRTGRCSGSTTRAGRAWACAVGGRGGDLLPPRRAGAVVTAPSRLSF